MDYTQQITQGIKRVRISAKLTQEKFAEKISLSVQGYRNIEQGKYLPTANTIDRICSQFNVTPIELLLPESSKNISELQNLIIAKIKNYDLEKLIKINNIIDIL